MRPYNEAMRWLVVIPGALVPALWARDVLGEAKVPRLAMMLTRARREADAVFAADPPQAPHWCWLWRAFGGAAATPVTAPYAWAALNQASAASVATVGQLWHCDPVHCAMARDHLLVQTLGDEAPTAAESAPLATEAAAAAAEAGTRLQVLDGHWFLQCEPAWQLDAVALDAALGQSMQEVLPRGADAARWRKLLTEVQIRWHHHPTSRAREAGGQLAINALWLHGGGTWQTLPASPFATLVGTHPVLQGWMLASGRPADALLPSGALPPADGARLSFWDGLLEAAACEHWGRWLQRLTAMERELDELVARAWSGGFSSVELVLGGRHCVRRLQLTRHDRWKRWRRPALHDLLAESDRP